MITRPALARTARVLALPTAACLALTALTSPASAARPDSSSNVRSGERASVSWTELDPANVLGLPGNTHIGSLFVEDGVFGSFAFGDIQDFDCDPGEVPGGHEEGPGTCTLMGVRSLQAEGGDLVVSGSTATWTGTILVTNGGHGEGSGGLLARVPATIGWQSTGALVRFRETFTYVDGKNSFRGRITGQRTDAATTTVSGALGRMGFADDPDDVAQGEFRTFTETFRERMR